MPRSSACRSSLSAHDRKAAGPSTVVLGWVSEPLVERVDRALLRTADAGAPAGVEEWWAHSWPANNVLSGGASPSGFKGFGLDVTLLTSSPPAVCGLPWTTSPGNSPDPPDTVPAYMGVLVSSSTSKSGSTISGNTTSIVVVAVDPGYADNPGKPGRGMVIATYCP